MSRDKLVRFSEEEVQKLKRFKEHMYGEGNADDIPHAMAVMDAIDGVVAADNF